MDAIMRLLKCEEPVTMKTDWFEMRDARLHLAPYSDPHFEIAVASTITPFGMIAAGTHGVGVLSIGAGLPGGPEALANQWKIAEDAAAKNGKTMDRKNWRVVVNAHIAEDDEQALREVQKGERIETQTYFEDTLGRPPGRADDPLRDGVKMGTTLVGSPETVIKGISRLLEYSQGGFGGILFRAHEWANREQTLRSFELFARYVMPQFQGSLGQIVGSNTWARENRKQVFGSTVEGGAARLHRFRPHGARGGDPRAHPRARGISTPRSVATPPSSTVPATPFSGVAGMSMCVTPSTDSASMMALISAGGLPTEPASPAPFTPSGLETLGTSSRSTSMSGKSVGARQRIVHEAAGQKLAGCAS